MLGPLAGYPLGGLHEDITPGQTIADIARSRGKRTFLAEIETLDAVAITVEKPPTPLGGVPLAGLPGLLTSLPQANKLFVSSRLWIGHPLDSQRRHTPYKERLQLPYTLTRSLPLTPETQRRSQEQRGVVHLDNADGFYDQLVKDRSVVGRKYRALLGLDAAYYRDFTQMISAIMEDWVAYRDRVEIQLQDLSYKLAVPVQSKYGGSGALDGAPAMAGLSKPEFYGRKYNIEPVMADQSLGLLHVHWRRIKGLTALRDRGIARPYHGDFSTLDDLLAEEIPSGYWAQCKAQGCVRVADAIVGDEVFRVDGEGDIDQFDDFSDHMGEIALRLMRDRLLLPSSILFTSTFSRLPTGAAGLYLGPNARPNCDEVLDDFLRSGLGWYGNTRDERLALNVVEPPEDGDPDFEFDDDDIDDLQPVRNLIGPRYAQFAGYRSTETPYALDEVIGIDDEATRALLTKEFQETSWSDGDVIARNLGATYGKTIVTAYAEQPDALQFCKDVVRLLGPNRRVFTVKLGRIGWEVDLGSRVLMTSRRYGLSEGQIFLVIRVQEDAVRDSVTLTLWG